MRIVVMGATGNVGGELVKLLVGDGHLVTTLSSHDQPPDRWPSSVQPYVVDLSRGETLREALTGSDAIFMLAGYDDAGIVQQLREAGTRRVILLSSSSVVTNGPENAVAAYHLASEEAVASSGLEWTFLRPNTFMTNTLRWAEAIRSGAGVTAPFADVAIAVNDPADIARVAAAALTQDGHAGCAYRITGPQALRPGEQVAIIAEALGRDVPFRAQSDAEARAEMLESTPAEMVDAFFAFFVDGTLDETSVLETITQVTGRPPRTYRDWVSEHIAQFT